MRRMQTWFISKILGDKQFAKNLGCIFFVLSASVSLASLVSRPLFASLSLLKSGFDGEDHYYLHDSMLCVCRFLSPLLFVTIAMEIISMTATTTVTSDNCNYFFFSIVAIFIIFPPAISIIIAVLIFITMSIVGFTCVAASYNNISYFHFL